MTEDQLFERWQSLDSEERNSVFPSLFGRMRHLRRSGTKGDKEAAERFFMEVENLITREQIEERIAAVSRDIDILNRRIAEAEKLAKERARLREKLGELTRWYTGECFRERLTEDMKQCIFAYKGKTKDLSEALASQIRKAQKIHPSSF